MAVYFTVSVTFTKVGDLEGLRTYLEEEDRDSPYRVITEQGFQGYRWRTPMNCWCYPEELGKLFTRFGFEGYGVIQEDSWEDDVRPSQFTFGAPSYKENGFEFTYLNGVLFINGKPVSAAAIRALIA